MQYLPYGNDLCGCWYRKPSTSRAARTKRSTSGPAVRFQATPRGPECSFTASKDLEAPMCIYFYIIHIFLYYVRTYIHAHKQTYMHAGIHTLHIPEIMIFVQKASMPQNSSFFLLPRTPFGFRGWFGFMLYARAALHIQSGACIIVSMLVSLAFGRQSGTLRKHPLSV